MNTIMIVDDDAVSLAIGKGVFSQKYRVLTARSGLQALGYLIGNEAPDVMLVDSVMPGMDGLTLLKQVKAQEETRAIPVILTDYIADAEVIQQAYQAGAAEFIIKPINPYLMQKKVEQALYVSALEKENRKLRDQLAELNSHQNGA